MHLFEELYDAVKKFGFKSNIVEDSFNNSISNLGLVYKSILLSILYKKKLEKEKTVAIMMPNTVITSVLFFALQNLNKTASIINFTSGITNIKSSLNVSKIKTIITSKNFVEQINMQENIIFMQTCQRDIKLLKIKHQFVPVEKLKLKLMKLRKILTSQEFIWKKMQAKVFMI